MSFFLKCCHIMLVILSRASICAVLTGWCSNSILAPASACALLSFKTNLEKKFLDTAYIECINNPQHSVLLQVFSSDHPAVFTPQHTTAGTERFWFTLGEFSCCPSLCTVNVYASTSILNSQNKSTTKVTRYLQQRQTRHPTVEMRFHCTFTKPEKDLQTVTELGTT